MPSVAFREKQIMFIAAIINHIHNEALMHIHTKSWFISHAGERKQGKQEDLLEESYWVFGEQ